MQSGRLIRCLPWISASLLVASCAAQVMQPTGTFPSAGPFDQHERPRAPGSTQAPVRVPQQPAGANSTPVANGAKAPNGPGSPANPPSPPAAPRPTLPPSLLDKPAQPATITLNKGVLAIHADNSSLSDILHNLSSSSGMAIDGFHQDQRVFGVYGPGNPRDVLSSLLQGAGYNFLLVGTTDKGTPREVVLTTRSGGGPVTASPAQPDEPADEDNGDNGDNNNSFPQPEPPAQEQQPPSTPPGAEVAPPTAPDGHVKTPAEIIQELQRMRQQQQNPQ